MSNRINHFEGFTFVSENKNKIAEYLRIQRVRFNYLVQASELADVTREILQLTANGKYTEVNTIQVTQEIKSLYPTLQMPIIKEKANLYIHGLGGFPGGFTKDFEGQSSNEVLARHANEKRYNSCDPHATVIVSLAATTDGENIQIRHGILTGEILPPKGNNNFGWDAIFKPDSCEEGITFGQLSRVQKSQISMRRILIEELKLNPFSLSF